MTEEVAAAKITHDVGVLAARPFTRVLLSFGNPFGNAVGDTALATQHISYLQRLLPKARITVWTASRELWAALSSTELDFAVAIGERDLWSFDMILIDWARVGPDTIEFLRCRKKLAIIWSSWGQNPAFISIDGHLHSLF